MKWKWRMETFLDNFISSSEYGQKMWTVTIVFSMFHSHSGEFHQLQLGLGTRQRCQPLPQDCGWQGERYIENPARPPLNPSPWSSRGTSPSNGNASWVKNILRLIFSSTLIFLSNWYFCQYWYFCQQWSFDIFVKYFWYFYQHWYLCQLLIFFINLLIKISTSCSHKL